MPPVKYEAVIGLEIHIQLNTASKAFCADRNQFTTDPNEHISAVSLALPGALPYMNIEHIRKAVKTGLALGCEINSTNYFDRKNYFYPDLPKGYQITQQNRPVCMGGSIRLENDRVIRIHHIHMEEDAGKSSHDEGSGMSLLDYNRAGVPLLELVTEPDFRTPDDVYHFVNEIRRLVRYLDVSDAIMQEGSLRCDVNISVRPVGQIELNTRTEIKNLNSANNARKAAELEINRQIEQYERGVAVIQRTLDYDPQANKLSTLREKEDAQEYRYFPEPDLPIIQLSEEWIAVVKESIDVLPQAMENDLRDNYGLRREDARIMAEHKQAALHFIDLCAMRPNMDTRLIGNFYVQQLLPLRRTGANHLKELEITNDMIIELLELIGEERISPSAAYQKLFPLVLDQKKSPASLAEELGLIQSSGADDIEKWIEEVLDENPGKVGQYLDGKRGLFGFFMGQVMKKSEGKANPKTSKQILEEGLNKRQDNGH